MITFLSPLLSTHSFTPIHYSFISFPLIHFSYPFISFSHSPPLSIPLPLLPPLSLGVAKVGSTKEIDGYEEESDDELELDGVQKELGSGKEPENIGSDSDSDEENVKVKKVKQMDSDDDSEEEEAPERTSSAKPPVTKTPMKKTSRVSFGTGSGPLIPPHTTPFKKSALGLGGQVGFDEEQGWVEMLLSYPATSRRLLMVQLGERERDYVVEIVLYSACYCYYVL